MYRLDRAAFKAQSFEGADSQIDYWLQRSVAERLRAATYLIYSAWNIDPECPPSIDRSEFRIRHRTMSNHIFNQDFQDFIKALNQHEVAYILVGGYAVIMHGYSRTTGDLDIWVKPDSENYRKLVQAFSTFGMPMFDMTLENFLAINRFDVFTFGNPPVAIDIMTKVKGLNFDETVTKASWHIFEDLKIRIIQYDDLLIAKEKAGRLKDQNDIEHLKKRKQA